MRHHTDSLKVIEDLAATLRVRRSELKVVAAGKGLFSGSIEIIGLDGVSRSGGTQVISIYFYQNGIESYFRKFREL